MLALLKAKADPLARDSEGKSPLHWAAHWGRIESVKLILAESRGVKPKSLLSAVDGEGYTPLTCAASEGHSDVVRYLLSKKFGMDVNAVDKVVTILVCARYFHGSIL